MDKTIGALQAGTVLESQSGKYKILKVLGKGGFGVTYLVEGLVKVGNISVVNQFALKEHFIDTMCEREGTSVKVVASNATAVSNSLKAFVKEATRLQKLGIEHGNIVKVNEVFEANNTAYYVMEYLEGETLEAYVRGKGSLSADEALKFMGPIVQAVANLHANKLTHYDIKPQNIILRKDRENENKFVPILIDFGLAKHYDEKGDQTSTTNFGGVSHGYSPTEQYAGLKKFSPWSDVYALAATFLFCLTGKTPTGAVDLKLKEVEAELEGKLNPTTLQILLKALSKDYEIRQQSAGELYKDLYGEEAVVEVVEISKSGSKEKNKGTDIIGKKPIPTPKPWDKIAAISAAVALLIWSAVFLLPKGSDTAADRDKDSDSIAQSTESPITPIVPNPPIAEQEEIEEQELVEEETPAPKPTTGTINGHEWVDLGLPSGLKWAKYNVGAYYPEEYGDYFAWGEITTKRSYTESNSKTHGEKINNISGNYEYDAAKSIWGETWRLPTKAEFEELLYYCYWTWTEINGHTGYLINSRSNNQSIFLPAAGLRLDKYLYNTNVNGGYWCSKPYEKNSRSSYSLFFDKDKKETNWGIRHYGRSIRPVTK